MADNESYATRVSKQIDQMMRERALKNAQERAAKQAQLEAEAAERQKQAQTQTQTHTASVFSCKHRSIIISAKK